MYMRTWKCSSECCVVSPTHSPSVVVAVLVLTQQRQVFDEDALNVEHFRRLLRLLDQAGDDLE